MQNQTNPLPQAPNPLDWSCPHVDNYGNNCAAQKGEKCREFDSVWGEQNEINTFHPERWEMAGGMSNKPGQLSKDAFDKDVIQTGLIF